MTKFEMYSHPWMTLFESKLQCYDDTARLYNLIIFGLKRKETNKIETQCYFLNKKFPSKPNLFYIE